MFVVEGRYEWWSRQGKVFNDWRDLEKFDTLQEAKEYMKHSKERIKSIDKATKLKHEYRITEK